MVYTQRLFY